MYSPFGSCSSSGLEFAARVHYRFCLSPPVAVLLTLCSGAEGGGSRGALTLALVSCLIMKCYKYTANLVQPSCFSVLRFHSSAKQLLPKQARPYPRQQQRQRRLTRTQHEHSLPT